MVDKVYAMLHTLKFKREYNIKKAWDDFYESHPKIVEEIDKNYGEKFDEFLKTWNEDGECNIPLSAPIHSTRRRPLLNSILKNTLNK